MVVCSAVNSRSYELFCLCAIPAVCLFDFYHAYAFFQRGHTSPDEYFPAIQSFALHCFRNTGNNVAHFVLDRSSVGNSVRKLPLFATFLISMIFSKYPRVIPVSIWIPLPGFRRLPTRKPRSPSKIFESRWNAMRRERIGWAHGPIHFRERNSSRRFAATHSRMALRHALEQGEFDWRNEAAVCESPGLVAERRGESGQPASTNDTIQFACIAPGSYSVAYKVDQPGIIFVSETFYPGWTATDGRVKLVKTFGAFQGIVIPEAGTGRITLHFSPSVFKWGIAITLLSIAATALLAFTPVGILLGIKTRND